MTLRRFGDGAFRRARGKLLTAICRGRDLVRRLHDPESVFTDEEWQIIEEVEEIISLENECKPIG